MRPADVPAGLLGGIFVVLLDGPQAVPPDRVDRLVIVGGVGGEGVFRKRIPRCGMAVLFPDAEAAEDLIQNILDIDPAGFWRDPYPALAAMRRSCASPTPYSARRARAFRGSWRSPPWRHRRG